MRIVKSIVFILILLMGLSACAESGKADTQPSTRKIESQTENTEGDNSMNREIVTICKINDDNIIVENTREEKYKIQDTSGDYTEGEYLMIHFKDDQKKPDASEEAEYVVTPSLIEKTSLEVQKPF